MCVGGAGKDHKMASNLWSGIWPFPTIFKYALNYVTPSVLSSPAGWYKCIRYQAACEAKFRRLWYQLAPTLWVLLTVLNKIKAFIYDTFSLFLILNRVLCRSLSCTGGGLSLPVCHYHTPASVQRQRDLIWVAMAKRHKHSDVWLCFSRIYADSAHCNKCNKSFACKGRNTSNLSKHPAKQHHTQTERCTFFW